MKCSQCGSDDVQFDSVGGMFYCPHCNILFDSADEIENEESEQDEDDESNEWVQEDLNGFSLIVLNLLASIPIVSVFVPIVINNSDVKDEYKKFFGYRFIVQVFMLAIALFLGVMLYKNYDINYQVICQESLLGIVKFMDPDIRDFDVSLNIPKTEFDVLSQIENDKQNQEVNDLELLSSENLELLDGSVLSGTKAMEIIDSTNGYQCSYMFQSKDIEDRHGGNVYRVVGWLLDGSYTDDKSGNNKAYFIEEKDFYLLYTDDYGEYVYCDISDLKNRRYVFYVNPKKFYSVSVLYSEDGIALGFAFKEVSFDK